MKTTINGVAVTLTPDQIAYINRQKAMKRRSCNSFKKVLKAFGFKMVNELNYQGDPIIYYTNEKEHWFAEIQEFGLCHDLFMAGKGLKHSSYPPGGWIYGTPESAAEALTEALEAKK